MIVLKEGYCERPGKPDAERYYSGERVSLRRSVERRLVAEGKADVAVLEPEEVQIPVEPEPEPEPEQEDQDGSDETQEA